MQGLENLFDILQVVRFGFALAHDEYDEIGLDRIGWFEAVREVYEGHHQEFFLLK